MKRHSFPLAMGTTAAFLGMAFIVACEGTPAPMAPASTSWPSSRPPPTPEESAQALPQTAAPPKTKSREDALAEALVQVKLKESEDDRARAAFRAIAEHDKSKLPATLVPMLLAASQTPQGPAFEGEMTRAAQHPPLSEGLDDLCGRPIDGVFVEVQKSDVKKHVESLYGICKLGRRIKFAEADLGRLHPGSVILALATREFLAKHDALNDTNEELLKIALYAHAQKR